MREGAGLVGVPRAQGGVHVCVAWCGLGCTWSMLLGGWIGTTLLNFARQRCLHFALLQA